MSYFLVVVRGSVRVLAGAFVTCGPCRGAFSSSGRLLELITRVLDRVDVSAITVVLKRVVERHVGATMNLAKAKRMDVAER